MAQSSVLHAQAENATTAPGIHPWSPDSWAGWVRDRYELDASEDVLLELAVDALRISRDEGQDARVRLQAAGRFQSLLRQLGLEAAEEEEARRGASEKDVVRFAAGR